MTSFEYDLGKREFRAANNIRLNAIASIVVLIVGIFPIFLPWYAEPNFENDFIKPSPHIPLIQRNKTINQTYLIFSLFSVFVNN